MTKRFEAKSVLITGASRGIGKGIAQRFAEEGGNLILSANEESVHKVAEELRGSGVNAVSVVCDVTKKAEVEALYDRALALGHPTREVYGVEQNTGALGHGLAVAVGIALAGKMDRKDYRVFCLLGDGELAEGSNWEAAMTAAHYRLDNLTAIVDRNGLQITGSTEDVCQLAPLDEKFEAFGFAVRRCDGNDVGELVRALESVPFRPGKPSLVLAKTRKGKGVSFMDNVAKWHHGVPNDEEFGRAMAELEAAEAALA